jgi:tRNA threonylcarbamoyladenosine biosynthesis protein TsaE
LSSETQVPDRLQSPHATTRFALPDEHATERLGACLADALAASFETVRATGITIGLSGDLGAGKTTLVRALLRRLGVAGTIKSPSYALLEPYAISRLNLYHFDFYRFKNPAEFEEAGFRELFGAGSLCLIEWPEKAGGLLAPLDVKVVLEIESSGRSARVLACSEIAERCVADLTSNWNKPAAGG